MVNRRGAPTLAERNAQMQAELTELEASIQSLRTRWDRYLMALERIPPMSETEALARALRTASVNQSFKTAMKFKLQSLQQRFNTYKRYWDRSMRMIEEGTLKREKKDSGFDPRSGRRDDKMRDLYREWTSAGQQVGQQSQISFEQFQRRIQAQQLKHQAKFGCADINYSVRVKDGKVAMVAKPVRDS